MTSAWVTRLAISGKSAETDEKKFTSEVLLPQLQEFVNSLKKPELYVRGDGGPSVIPLVWNGISFFPDMSIVSSHEKYVAFEVKVLRDSDPGGSLSKAIGQTFLYRKLGYVSSFGIIFDLRVFNTSKKLNFNWSEKILSVDNTEVHILN